MDDLPLVSGAQYKVELRGIDLAGNSTVGVSERVFFYDTTPPRITMDSPIDGASINHLNFSFTISEPIYNGQLIFTDENGQIGKHPLSADQLNTLVLVDDPLFIPVNLQDGSTYSLKLIGADVAGNSADSDIQNGIHYDITKPSFSISL